MDTAHLPPYGENYELRFKTTMGNWITIAGPLTQQDALRQKTNWVLSYPDVEIAIVKTETMKPYFT